MSTDADFTPKRVLLLDNYAPDHPDYLPLTGMSGPEYRNVIRNRFSAFSRELFETKVEMQVVEMETAELPDILDLLLGQRWDLVIVSGSPFNAADRHRPDGGWIARQIEAYRIFAQKDRQTPFLGVCFGHQLFALAKEGRLKKTPEYLNGFTGLCYTDGSVATVYRSHGWYIHTLPAGARVVAGSQDRIASRVMPYKLSYPDQHPNVLTTQIHPEFPTEADRYSIVLLRQFRSLLFDSDKTAGTGDAPHRASVLCPA